MRIQVLLLIVVVETSLVFPEEKSSIFVLIRSPMLIHVPRVRETPVPTSFLLKIGRDAVTSA